MSEERKKKAEESEGGGGGWLVSFADLMTLLFAAFVVLYGITSHGESTSHMGALSSIRRTLNEIPDIIPTQEEGPIKKGKYLFKAYEGDSPTIPPERMEQTQFAMSQIETDRARVDVLIDKMASSKDAKNLELRQAISVDPDDRGFKVVLFGATFYESGAYRMSRVARKRMVELGSLLKSLERKLLIEGHTDSAERGASQGRQVSDERLGALRAGDFVEFLVREVGVSPFYLESVSFGSKRPIGDNKDAEGRRRNRRIEIKILY